MSGLGAPFRPNFWPLKRAAQSPPGRGAPIPPPYEDPGRCRTQEVIVDAPNARDEGSPPDCNASRSKGGPS